jgi:hypothetical protein
MAVPWRFHGDFMAISWILYDFLWLYMNLCDCIWILYQ